MALSAVSPVDTSGFRLTRPIELACVALCMAQAFFLVASFIQGCWLVDVNGHAVAYDFVNVWASGRQVLDGNPAAAYDLTVHKEVETSAIGHPFDGFYPWNYPPPALFMATLLARFPLVTANVAWLFLTFLIYLAVVRGIIGHRNGILLACAYPGILFNLMVGQNGFVTAALLGGSLVFLERNPIPAGCLIGLLSFKPQLGFLFPLVLMAGGHWRVMGAATIVVLLLIVLSWSSFGTSTWEAFFQAMPSIWQAVLTQGRGDWAKLQSVFGLARLLGGSEGLAWALHGSLVSLIAILLFAMWHSKISFDMRAAALATGALLATPYLFIYDLVVLAVPMAFLVRASMRSGDMQNEMLRLAPACLLVPIFLFVKAPVGLAAILVVALLIARRVRLEFKLACLDGKSLDGASTMEHLRDAY
jgi:arabinofuranan 3-O-arabinosyltransferase